MNNEFNEINSLVSEIKRNTNFIGKLLFPRIGIVVVVGLGLLLIAFTLLH